MKKLHAASQINLLTKVGLLAIVFVLSGCQGSATQQQANAPVAPPDAVVTFAQANRCLNDLNQSELGKRVFSQILYSRAILPEHTYLETSTKYLSDDQVELLKEFRDKNKECRSLRSQAMGEYELRVQLAIFHDEMDHMFDELQHRRLTIGQGNKLSKEIRARYQAAVRKFFDRSKEVDEDRVG
jgi:hypothetical protein